MIILEHTTSGDGIVTALEVLRVMAPARARRSPSWPPQIPLLPQQQRTVRSVTRTSGKAIGRCRRRSRRRASRLGDGGRILVRPSGTEPALRVMVEGRGRRPSWPSSPTQLAALAGERLN